MNIISSLKKGIAGLAFVAMSLAIMPAASAMTFTDSSEIPSWATEAIDELSAMGVLGGNDDGSFAPARQLNRAEVAKIIVMASGVDMDTYGGPNFPDVSEDAWYYDYIETMYNYGWVNGYPDGKFRPGNGINRAEIAKMVVNALELEMDTTGAPHFDDVMASDWFFDYVETAYNYDLMRGYADGTFGPTKAVTRAETAKIVYDGLLATTTPTGPAEGTLEVSLSMETPRGTNVPYNATSVPYTTIELTASDDSDVEISSLTFTRLGLGDNDDFNSIWMEIDGFKVGNDKSINNDDIVELRFNPPVVVPAGQTLMADVVASAKYTSSDKNIGHHNRLAVVSASDVASTAMNVVGDFPIEGEEMEVADYLVSQIDFSNLGSDTTIDVGDNFIEIGKFRMLNESTSNKDIELRAITFKNDGTAELENVLENLALYVSGEQVSAESIIDGDYVTFRLDNGVTGGYILEDGDSRIFSMRADIVSAERSDTIELKVDNYEDIVAIEIGTSFGVKSVSDSFNDAGAGAGSGSCSDSNAEDNCARLGVYTIDSGDLNISRDPSSLGNQQYAPGSNDVVAMTARVIVDQPLLADGVTLTATYGNTVTSTLLDTTTEVNAQFSNFRLFLNDSLIDSENATTELVAATSVQIVYDTTFEIAGASILKLVMNIQDAASTGSWIKFNINGATAFASPEYISTGDQVVASQMLGSAAASKVEVTSSQLNITKTDGFSSETIVAGLDDVTFMEFVLDNNDSGDVNVTSISVTANGADAAQVYANFTAAVFVDGTQQGSSKNLSGSGATSSTTTFNDLSVVIPSAGQKEFAIVLNTLEASADGGTADTLDINITAVDADNVENGQTVVTYNGGTAIASAPLDGADFTLVQSGSLVQSIGSTVYSDILIAGAKDVEVLKIRYNAANDAIQIKDLYLENNLLSATNIFGPRADFKLYNEAGQLIQTKQMQSGDTLHFELANQDRINVPKDNSTFVTVKIDVRDISQAAMTGKRLQLVDRGSQTITYATSTKFTLADDPASANITIGDQTIAVDIAAATTAAAVDTAASDLFIAAAIADAINTNGVYTATAALGVVTVQTRATIGAFTALDAAINATNAAGAAGAAATVSGSIGADALTAATGTDVVASSITGTYTGEAFVAYRSQLSVKHAATQPSFQDPSSASQEIYRFSVTADAARQVELGRVSFDVALSGMDASATNNAFLVKLVKSDGTIDNTASVGSVIDTFGTTNGQVSGVATVNFSNQKLSAGETRTYALFMDNLEDSGGSADDDAVSISIKADTSYASPAAKATVQVVAGTAQVDTLTLTGTSGTATITAGGVSATATFNTTLTTTGSDFDTASSAAFTAAGITVTNASGVLTFTAAVAGTPFTAATITNATGDLAGTVVNTTANAYGTNTIWSDESSNSHTDLTSDWLNGYLLETDTTAKVIAD